MKRANLNLFTACNYSCPYCCAIDKRKTLGRAGTEEGTQKIVEFFNGLEEEWEIQILGGEPSLSPYYLRLCRELSQKHILTINTNNSLKMDEVREFAHTIDSRRVRRLSCSLHIADEEPARLAVFTEKLLLLKQNAFPVSVNYVCAPERLAKLGYFQKYFADMGLLILFNQALRQGVGASYPPSTEKEDETVALFMGNNPVALACLRHKPVKSLGRACPAGRELIFIDGYSGDIIGCPNDSRRLGNVYDRELTLEAEEGLCLFETCAEGTAPLSYDFNNLIEAMCREHFSAEPDYGGLYERALSVVRPLANPELLFSPAQRGRRAVLNFLPQARLLVNGGRYQEFLRLASGLEVDFFDAELRYLYALALHVRGGGGGAQSARPLRTGPGGRFRRILGQVQSGLPFITTGPPGRSPGGYPPRLGA